MERSETVETPSRLPVSVLAVIGTVVIANLGNNIVAPVMPVIRDNFGSTAAEVGLVASGFAFGRLVMDLPAGYLADRISPTRFFAAGILLTGGAAALAAFSTTIEQLILFRTAMGLGAAIMSTVALALLVNIAGPRRRGQVLAYYTSGLLFGQAISPSIGGYLATIFDWRAAFVFCALTPFVSLPLNLMATSKVSAIRSSHWAGENGSERSARRTSGRVVSTGRSRANRPALVAVYFATFANFLNRQGMRQSLLPLYGGMILRMDPGVIGAILTTGSILTILINLPSGSVADRIGRKQLLIPGMLTLCVGNAILYSGGNQLIFVLATIFISMGVLANSMQSGLVADLLPDRSVGKGMGMYRFSADLGMVIGPFLLGTALDRAGFPAALAVGGTIVLIAVVAALVLVPRRANQLAGLRAED